MKLCEQGWRPLTQFFVRWFAPVFPQIKDTRFICYITLSWLIRWPGRYLSNMVMMQENLPVLFQNKNAPDGEIDKWTFNHPHKGLIGRGNYNMMTSSMEIFSALLALCAGNSAVTGEFPSQRPVTRSFDVFFDLRWNKRLSKQSRRRGFETPSHSLWCHCNEICHMHDVTVMSYINSSRICWHNWLFMN